MFLLQDKRTAFLVLLALFQVRKVGMLDLSLPSRALYLIFYVDITECIASTSTFKIVNCLCMIICFADTTGGNSTSCSQLESVIIVVILPMSKTDFIANKDRYIASVASTANVTKENVEVLTIDEVSTRSSRDISRLLLATSAVRIQTSVLIAIGQHTNFEDQSLLNSNLNKNGLPSGRLIVLPSGPLSTSLATPVAVASLVFVITTPAPESGCGELFLPLKPLPPPPYLP